MKQEMELGSLILQILHLYKISTGQPYALFLAEQDVNQQEKQYSRKTMPAEPLKQAQNIYA